MRFGEWREKGRAAPVVDLDLLAGGGGVVVMAPHPDDETLGCGGLIAEAAARGTPLGLVALTDGEASHPGSAAFPPERLAAVRREEQAAALASLGAPFAPILRLGLPDGRVHLAARPEQEAERIGAFCDELRATALFVTSAQDPHCDHVGAAALAARVAAPRPWLRLFSYPVWETTCPDDKEAERNGLRPFRLAVGSQLSAKRRAIDLHLSQLGRLIDDDPDGFVLPAEFVESFMGAYEHYFWHEPDAVSGEAAELHALSGSADKS